MTKTTDIPTCRILIDNQVLRTRTELNSPQSVAEAMKNCFPVCLAHQFARFYGDEDGNEPIGVAISQTDDRITIRWHAVGDDDAARARMLQVLSDEKWWTEEDCA